MSFPVDILSDVRQEELERTGQNCMNSLLFSNPDSPQQLTLANSTQVTIGPSNVGFVPIYGANDKQKVLALFSPSDLFSTVALYLLDRWWTVEDILKTADPTRDGVVEVETLGERIVLYILNRVIYRAKEMSTEELPFLLHGENAFAKILWKNGEAVGFYSVKPAGSICSSFLTRSYQLPVMDSIFVRKHHRSNGLGLQMLEDFVLSFKEDCLGLRYPLTKAMYKVCQKYLSQYPEDRDLLWEVESIGVPSQRTNIANKIRTMDLSAVSKNLSFVEESLVISEVTENDVVMEAITTCIEEHESMECTVEIVEEVTVVKAANETEEIPVTTRGRSSGFKRSKMGEKITEDNNSEKVIRIEDIEAETPKEVRLAEQEVSELHKTVQAEDVVGVAAEEKAENQIDKKPEDKVDTMSDKSATVPATISSQEDLEETKAEVTEASTGEEPPVEDISTQDLNKTSYDPQITIENVVSEIEKEQEESQKEDAAELVVPKETGEVCRGAEALDDVQEGTKFETTSQSGTRVLRARTLVVVPTPKRKYIQRSQKECLELEKRVDEMAEKSEASFEPTAVAEESAVMEEKVQEEIPVEVTAINQEILAVQVDLAEDDKTIQGKGQVEDEKTTEDQVETEKQEESEVEDTFVEENATEVPDTEATVLQSEEEKEATIAAMDEQRDVEVETSVIQDQPEVSEGSDEEEDPPVFYRRPLRGKLKVVKDLLKPKLTRQSKRSQPQKEENKDNVEQTAEHPCSIQKEDEQKTGKQVKGDRRVEKEPHGTPEKVEVVEKATPLSAEEVSVEKRKVEEEMTEGVAKNIAVLDGNMEAASISNVADGIVEEIETDTELAKPSVASVTVIPDEDQEKTKSSIIPEAAVEEGQEEGIASQTPKLQKATVVLVDLKKTYHHLEAKEIEKTAAVEECFTQESTYDEEEQKEQTLAEKSEKELPSSIVEEQKMEPEKLVVEEQEGVECENIKEKATPTTAEAEIVEEEDSSVGEEATEKQSSTSDALVDGQVEIPSRESAQEKLLPAYVDEAKSLDEEEVPVAETRALRSGIKAVKATPKRKYTRRRQQEEEEEEETDVESKDEEEPAVQTDEEEPVVQKRVLRKGIKAVKAYQKRKHTRGQQEEEEKKETDLESSDEEEPAIQTRTLRKGKKCAPVTPRRKSKRARKQLQEEAEEEGEEESITAEEEAPVAEARALRSGIKVVKATPKRKYTRRRQQEEEEEEETDVESKDEEEPAVQTDEEELVVQKRVLRKQRKSAPVTPRRKSERARKQLQEDAEEEGEEESITAEEIEVEKEEAGQEAAEEKLEKIDEEIEEKAEEEAATQTVKNIEPESEVDKGKAVAEEADTIEDSMEQKESETFGDGEVDTPAGEEAEVEGTEVEEQEAEQGATEEKEEKKDKDMIEENVDEEAALQKVEGIESEIVVEKGKVDAEETVTVQDTMEETAEPSADKEVETTIEESAEENLVPIKVNEATSQEQVDEKEEEAALEKNSDENEPAVITRVLRKGRKSVPVTPKRKYTSHCKHLQQEDKAEGESKPAEETEVEKEEARLKLNEEKEENEVKEMVEEKVEEEAAPQKEQSEQPEIEVEEGKAPGAKGEKTGEEPAFVTVEEEVMEEVTEEVTMTLTEKEENTKKAEIAIAADEIVQETETHTLTVKHTADSGMLTPTEDQEEFQARCIPSNEELQREDTAPQFSNLQRATVVLVDFKKNYHELQVEEIEETATVGENASTEKPAAEAEDEQREQSEKEKKAQDHFQSSVEEHKVVLEKSVVGEGVEEERVEEDAITPAEVEDIEKAKLDEKAEKEAVTEENEVQTMKTRALRSGRTTVKATTGCKSTKRSKQEQENKKEEEKAGVESNADENEPAVQTRVLRQGSKSTPVTPRHKSKRARKQPQEEEEEAKEDSTTEMTEVEQQEAEQGAAEEEQKDEMKEKLEEEIEVEKGKAVSEETVITQDAMGKKEFAETSADVEVEIPVDIPVEESAEENLSPAKLDSTKSFEEEQAPVAEIRALRSGGKTVKATPKRKSTRRRQQEEEQEKVADVESGDEEEPAVQTGVLRKGRKSAPVTPRHKSKRARKQLQEEAEEEGEEDSTTAEEIEIVKEEAGQEAAEEKLEEIDEEIEEKAEEEAATQTMEGIESESEVGRGKAVAEEADTKEDTVEQKESGTFADGEVDTAAGEEAEVEGTEVEEQEAEQGATEEKKDKDMIEENVDEEAALQNVEGIEVEKGKAVAEEAVTVQGAIEEKEFAETSADAELETPVEENAEENLLPTNVDEARSFEAEEVPVVEARALRSGGQLKTIEAISKHKHTRRGQQEEETTVINSTDEDEPAVETRVLRKGRKSSTVTPRRASKRDRKQLQKEDVVGAEKSTPAEEIEIEKKEAGQEVAEGKEEKNDEEIEEKDEEEGSSQKVESIEPEIEVEKENPPAEEAVTIEDKMEEKESTVSETSADGKAETPVGGEAEGNILTAKVDEATEEEEAPVAERRALRSGGMGRKSVPVTPRCKSKRARKQLQEEEREEEFTAEEIETEKEEAGQPEVEEDAATQTVESIEPEIEAEIGKAAAEESVTVQDTTEEKESPVSKTFADGEAETPAGGEAEEKIQTVKVDVVTSITEEEETPVVETTALRSRGKTVEATPRCKSTRSKQQEEAAVENSDQNEPALEARVLRRGRKSAPVTPIRKSKRARKQLQEYKETVEEESTTDEETEAQEKEAGLDSVEEIKEKEIEEEVQEEVQSQKMEVEREEAGEEEQIVEKEGEKEGKPEEESALAIVEDEERVEEKNKVMSDIETAEEERLADQADDGALLGSVEIAQDKQDEILAEKQEEQQEKTEEADEKETADQEQAEAEETIAGEPDKAEEEAVVDTSELAKEEAPAVITRALRSKTKNVQATPSRRSKRQKSKEEQNDREVGEVQQQKEGRAEGDKAQGERVEKSSGEDEHNKDEVLDSPENREELDISPSKEKQDDTEEITPTSSASEKETESPEEELVESKDEGSVGKDKGEDKVAESLANMETDMLEKSEDEEEENIENSMEVSKINGEEEEILNLALDEDEVEEKTGTAQEDNEEELSISEEDDEPVMTGKRVLRGRLVPSVVITPGHKSTRRNTKGKKEAEKPEGFVQDEDPEQSPHSAQRRGPRKRKSTELSPMRRSKRHSRV